MTKNWNKVILFGDSLTQRSFEPEFGCWGSLLADKLQRISDVMVRGFSGYNTRWCKTILSKVFPNDMNVSEVSCLTILLGANDANSPESPSNQFVPIDEYENNLIEMITYLDRIGIKKERLILISPPTYHYSDHVIHCKLTGRPEPIKDNTTVGKYAIACRSAAQRSGVEFVDLYEAFSNQKDGQTLFCDGLHFSRKGSQLLFDLIWPLVEKRVKQFNQCSELTMNFPIYSNIDTSCLEKSLLQ